jgi:nitric oxide synthase oxygenase domain/subunit
MRYAEEDFEDVLEEVDKAILLADRHLLTSEVMSTAIQIARQNPNKPIKQLMEESLRNWDL